MLMKKMKRPKGIVIVSALMALLMLFIFPSAAQAAGGMAMSGTFSGSEFNIPPGGQISGESIFVSVGNNSDGKLTVQMTYTAPRGVEIAFSQDELDLNPGENEKVYLTIESATDAVPGEYDVIVTATAAPPVEAGKIGVGVALAQKASLTISGEAAEVSIQAVNPNGQPVIVLLRLFSLIGGRTTEFASSQSGLLETRVTPGEYSIAAYLQDKKLTEEQFTVLGGETREVNLEVKTVYIDGFAIAPAYYDETGELAFVQLAYILNNLYQAFPEAEIVLKVTKDGVLLEEQSLATLAPLEKGKLGMKSNYIPTVGWGEAIYTFRLDLYTAGKVYISSQTWMFDSGTGDINLLSGEVVPTLESVVETTSPEAEKENTTPEAGEGSPAATGGSLFSWPIIGGIAGGVALLVACLIFLLWRRAFLQRK